MKKILVVDDEESVRVILKQILEKGGFEVDVASDGEDAMLKLKGGPFDMLVSDINMPRMDGVALLKKSKEAYPKMPVIFITAYGKDKVIMEAMKTGLSNYIEKPFKMDDVTRTIKENL